MCDEVVTIIKEERSLERVAPLIFARSHSNEISVPVYLNNAHACNKDVYCIIITFENENEIIERLRCCA